MDFDIFSENMSFTFTWKIENFCYSSLKNGEFLLSPVFVVDSLWNCRWRLKIYPKGNTENTKDFISFFLIRDITCNGPWNVDIHYDLSFIGTDGSCLVSAGTYENTFLINKSWGYGYFVERDVVLKVRRKDYLPGDTLTARCRIGHGNEITNYGHCYARTRIGVKCRSFTWTIEQFSSFQESTCDIRSSSSNQPMITLKCFPSSKKAGETFIRVEVCAYEYWLNFSTFRIDFVDTSGNRTECLNEETIFNPRNKTASFTLTISNEELRKNGNRYLPNDILQLYCECVFSTGIQLGEIEKIISLCSPLIQEENLSSDGCKSKKICLDSKEILYENLEALYKENLLCDTKLKTKTGSFPAHKSILSARSPVFKAMFTHDMKEKNSECVNIDDLDDDTIQRMLLYIYTAKLQDLQWDSACNLYVAADKYEILSLKSECFSFLKDSLTQDNACNFLIFANKHLGENLNLMIQDYILNHKNIFHSDEWKHLMKTNLQLAASLMYRKCTE
ncbi:TD and POZ domain-containing protein 5 [Trichonephila clavipes]|nr:TD and POZ domain-containing protein 5 [Trichonephila clavipes]